VNSERIRRRASLREFQEALSRRIAASAGTVREDVRLGVRAGNRLWLLRLPDAGEILSIPPLTPVPLTRPWFRGMANVRGNLHAVIDLGQFLGAAATAPSPAARMLLVGRLHGTNAALIVERVLGLRHLRDLAPRAHARNAEWTGAEYADAQDQQWHELDVGALLQAPEFMAIAA
jgi:twitching motility protein PilI